MVQSGNFFFSALAMEPPIRPKPMKPKVYFFTVVSSFFILSDHYNIESVKCEIWSSLTISTTKCNLSTIIVKKIV